MTFVLCGIVWNSVVYPDLSLVITNLFSADSILNVDNLLELCSWLQKSHSDEHLILLQYFL